MVQLTLTLMILVLKIIQKDVLNQKNGYVMCTCRMAWWNNSLNITFGGLGTTVSLKYPLIVIDSGQILTSHKAHPEFVWWDPRHPTFPDLKRIPRALFIYRCCPTPPKGVNQHRGGKAMVSIGQWSTNDGFSTSMLVYRTVIPVHPFPLFIHKGCQKPIGRFPASMCYYYTCIHIHMYGYNMQQHKNPEQSQQHQAAWVEKTTNHSTTQTQQPSKKENSWWNSLDLPFFWWYFNNCQNWLNTLWVTQWSNLGSPGHF